MFDDCQDIVKALQTTPVSRKTLPHQYRQLDQLGARAGLKSLAYFYGYFRATTSNEQKVSFCVPSGNFGNVCAGHIARQMGLPIHRLMVATNENDVLDRFFKTGEYRPRNAAHTYVTSSPSMDAT